MDSQLQRTLTLGSIVLALSLVAACGKEAATCDTSAQCENGFICSADGVCESFDASPADAPPPCPEATHFCATPVPADWTGPVVGTQAAIGETLAACPGDFSTEAIAVGEIALGNGDCGCSCSGTATDVLCGDAAIVERPSTGECLFCNVIGDGCDSRSIPPTNACTLIPGNVGDRAAVKVFMGGVTNSGSCGLPIVNSTLSTSFASDERYCSAEALPATCASEGVCLPNVNDAEFSAMCIYQRGDHECPAGYPAKETRHESIADMRECSECSCGGPAVGQSCGGVVSIGANTSNGCPVEVQVTATSCIANPVSTQGLTAARYAPAPDTTCNLTGGEKTGEVTAADEVTFCCTEAIADPEVP